MVWVDAICIWEVSRGEIYTSETTIRGGYIKEAVVSDAHDKEKR